MLRAMQSTDLHEVARIGKECFGESAHLSSMPFDEDKAAGFVTDVMAAGFAVVYEHAGRAVGMMLGDVIAPWYSRGLMGVEHILAVEPASRGTPAAPMLIQAWEAWCEDMGAQIVRLSVSSEYEAAGRLYQRIGYRHAGGNYFRVL